MIDMIHINVKGLSAVVSLASHEDERQYRSRGRWIYSDILVVEFNNNLYRVVL